LWARIEPDGDGRGRGGHREPRSGVRRLNGTANLAPGLFRLTPGGPVTITPPAGVRPRLAGRLQFA
jgi:hypothetical protein